MKYIFIYLIMINLAGFFVCYLDKRKAQKKQWRISEKTLFLLAFLGGGVGLYAGFKKFRHKTLHKRFMIGVPIIIVVELGVLIYFLVK